MSEHHHHHDNPAEETNELLKKLIILTCDLVEQGQTQILQNRHIIRLLHIIAAEDAPPYLATIQLLLKGINMPTPGPITLNAAGQTAQTVVVGLDQFGQPWTGAIPAGTYTDDNPGVATTDANGVVTAVTSGTDNATVSLTTVEGLPLTASIQVIVDIPVQVPVLSSISLQQA